MDTIKALEKSLKIHHSVSDLISKKDIDKWNKKISGYENPNEDYVLKSKFNLLTSLILSESNESAKALIKFLESSIQKFPELIESDSFKRNIKSLDDFAFFSFLSELSLSAYFKSLGLKISFNNQYQKIKKDKTISKDVDILAQDKNGNSINIEVYTPNSESDINGFFDMNELEKGFEKKVKVKEYDKFDGLISGDLHGKIMLAINYAYDENFKLYLTGKSNDFFQKIEEYMHHEINIILLFHHDIACEKELKINKMIIKNNR